MAEKIKINVFSRKSISDAISRVQKKQDDIEGNYSKTVEQLTQIGFEYMLTIVKMESGALADSITWEYDPETKTGRIKVGAAYAIFVEYGTGVRGAASPHPEKIPGWTYDVNGHGEAGWWYPTTASDPNPTKKQASDGSWIAHTKGQPASAFVYRTYQYMKKHAGEVLRVNMGNG